MNPTNDLLTCDTLIRARTRPTPCSRTLRTDVDGDKVANPVTIPDALGVRLLDAIPGGGPVVTAPGVRSADDLPVRLYVVTAELDSRLRRRIRTECADLEAMLAALGDAVVVPLLDHGTDRQGRPF